MTARTLTCQVVEVEDLTPDVFRVHLEGRAEAMAHAPGQYLEMQLDPATWVPFSIANAHDGDLQSGHAAFRSSSRSVPSCRVPGTGGSCCCGLPAGSRVLRL